ncbi:AAA family ATPase [Streptomyces sp. NPDC085463]|uniref:AAA family ATPase n=1 Tax=Streptomyces sp. NPDC085463 TaxID=3365724 RepID=UPI0037D664DB
MQHAVGGPLPPHERSGGAPGPVPAAGDADRGGPPPVHPAPGAGSRLGVHPAVPGGTSAPRHPAPPPAAPPHPAPTGQGTPGWSAGGSGGIPGHPPAPRPPSQGAPQGPAAPHHPTAPPLHRAEPTGQVPLPPPVAPLAPPAEHGAGTGGATLAVLLIGPAGAGKTTVARHWARRRRVPTAHISLDDVREWVCSGFADPQSGWNEHSEAQYRLARRTCGFAARNFLANGISCIVDDAVFPDRPVVGLGGWKRHVGPGLLPVVLLPGLEVVLERNAERSGNRRLSDEEVAAIHGRMAGWYGSGLPIIDNSTYDVETTARVLDDVLARAIASPPSW